MTALLRADGVAYSPAGQLVLDDVSLEARAGEVLALTGPSGSGKSSMLALLSGLVEPAAGTVAVDGVAPSESTASFGLVLQGYGLVAVLTAAENVEVALQARGVAPAEVRERAAEVLAAVGLGDLADRAVEELSGGQRQRVAVARAIVTEPDVLLADEPTAQQDAATKQVLVGLLRSAADRGAVVVVATHDPELVEACDREVALHDGRIVA